MGQRSSGVYIGHVYFLAGESAGFMGSGAKTVRASAGPDVVRGLLDDSRADRIHLDITKRVSKVSFAQHTRKRSLLPEVADRHGTYEKPYGLSQVVRV